MADVLRIKKNLEDRDKIDVGIFRIDDSGPTVPQLGSVTYSRNEDDGEFGSALSITREAARELLDDLWDAGIRPTKPPEPHALLALTQQQADRLFEVTKLALSK